MFKYAKSGATADSSSHDMPNAEKHMLVREEDLKAGGNSKCKKSEMVDDSPE